MKRILFKYFKTKILDLLELAAKILQLQHLAMKQPLLQ